jgi:hypothetical protein
MSQSVQFAEKPVSGEELEILTILVKELAPVDI